MPRRVTILGSTGSIGNSALDVLRRYPDKLCLQALSTRSDIAQLAQQVEEFSPEHVAIMDEEAAQTFSLSHPDLTVHVGIEGLCALSLIHI